MKQDMKHLPHCLSPDLQRTDTLSFLPEPKCLLPPLRDLVNLTEVRLRKIIPTSPPKRRAKTLNPDLNHMHWKGYLGGHLGWSHAAGDHLAGGHRGEPPRLRRPRLATAGHHGGGSAAGEGPADRQAVAARGAHPGQPIGQHAGRQVLPGNAPGLLPRLQRQLHARLPLLHRLLHARGRRLLMRHQVLSRLHLQRLRLHARRHTRCTTLHHLSVPAHQS